MMSPPLPLLPPPLLLPLPTHPPPVSRCSSHNNNKTKIENTQQNCMCRLCGAIDETINHIISQWSKLAQKEYKTRHDWVRKVIHLELCKKSNFDHITEWYIPKLESVLENEMSKILSDFPTQTDHLITTRKPDLVFINTHKKRSYLIVDFAVSANHRVKIKESE